MRAGPREIVIFRVLSFVEFFFCAEFCRISSTAIVTVTVAEAAAAIGG
jgi:hypothetical protein